jgi:hypothetical protein
MVGFGVVSPLGLGIIETLGNPIDFDELGSVLEPSFKVWRMSLKKCNFKDLAFEMRCKLEVWDNLSHFPFHN